MEVNRCSRCGNFYISDGNVCPKCNTKDGFEFSTFKSYIKENGLNNSLDSISGETGISTRNLNRFLGSQEFKDFQKELNNTSGELNNGNISGNTGIFFN